MMENGTGTICKTCQVIFHKVFRDWSLSMGGGGLQNRSGGGGK